MKENIKTIALGLLSPVVGLKPSLLLSRPITIFFIHKRISYFCIKVSKKLKIYNSSNRFNNAVVGLGINIILR